MVHNVDEALDFIGSLHEIEITQQLVEELHEYANGKVRYPKRYKVRPRVYFIIIKTEAATLQDFKDKKALNPAPVNSEQKLLEMALQTQCEGWYEGTFIFKRVIVNHLGKCEYRDTTFTVRCKAQSPQDCYNRIKEHLEQRVDKRSQFPSIKGKNFSYTFLGKCK